MERGAIRLDNPYVIEMLHITKKFPGIIANDDITLQLRRGEIHALLGENGAGKSTLMSVLFGMYQPEEGEIHKDGKLVHINNPNDANDLVRLRAGVACPRIPGRRDQDLRLRGRNDLMPVGEQQLPQPLEPGVLSGDGKAQIEHFLFP